MKIALTTIHAASGPPEGGRDALVRALVLGCAVACASLPAAAGLDQDRDGPRAAPAPQMQPAQPAPREPRRAERMAPPPEQAQAQPRQGDALRPDQRQVQPQDQGAQHGDAGRRGARLTADERRELRRQINEAGVDLYPNTPRR